ncbi:catalase family protein [uncultured Jatrophihabitans sp.]|uniref:catalase family protein n=1 Tax=uncultured Jatrophihabitans sp. TaxID=1610747 RepID=UPI0035CBCEF4
MPSPTPTPYSDDVETELPHESEIVDETISTMKNTMAQGFEVTRHATSGTHAKSHGIVTGTLRVHPDLPAELAQGLFAEPGQFEVVVRYASEPGAVDPDTAPRARGLALKVLDVPGVKLKPGWTSQDFLFNTWPIIPQGDASTYLDVIKQRDQHFGHHLRTVLGTAVQHPVAKETIFDRTPNIHPVAFTYYSQSAFRYGDYVAKFAIAPADPEQQSLAERTVSKSDPPGILRDWVQEFYRAHTARYDFQVQVQTDRDTMPVEDASVEWPEADSPFRTVASLELPVQESFSPARRVFAEDVMSWRPWNGLAAHRPLGSLNRLRRRAYDELGAVRRIVAECSRA